MAETTMATMAEMVCGRNLLWPKRLESTWTWKSPRLGKEEQ
jgi:hypothetical protein